MDCERYQLVLDIANEGFWDWDLKTDRAYLSPRYCELIGYSPDDTIFDSTLLGKIIHPDDRQQVFQVIQELCQGICQMHRLDYRIVSKDGAIRWVEGRSRIVEHDEQGHASRMVGTVIDITERKLAEKLAKENEERLRFALETSQTGAWELDLINHTAVRSIEHDHIFGYSELLPQWTYETFLEHVMPEDRAFVNDKFRQAMECQSDWNFECRIRRVDSQIRWIWAAGRHFNDATGTPSRMAGVVQDITGRKQIEKELRDSEERSRLLAETMLQGVVHQDADGKIISMNPAAGRILGKSPEEFLGETSVSVEHHTLREDGSPFSGSDHPAMVALQKGKLVRGVVMGVFNPREQGYRWINIDAVPLFRPGEDLPFQVYTVFEDITECKQAEKELSLTNERLRQLLDALPVGVTIAEDPECNVISTNPAASQLFEVPRRMNISAFATDGPAHRYFHQGKELKSEEMPLQLAVFGNRDVLDVEIEAHLFSGRHWTGLVSATPLRDLNGSVIGGIAVIRDITDRKKAEESLRESEERFRTAFEDSAVAMAMTALDGKLLKVNSVFSRMLGYTEEEMTSRSFAEFTHPDDLPENLAGIEKLVKGEVSSFRMDKRYFRKDGAVVWGDMSASNVRDPNGIPLYLVTHVQDITERKLAERKLEELSQRLSYHIDNSPLAVIEWGPDMRLIRWSGVAERVFGWKAEEVLGKRMEDFRWIYEEDVSLVAEISSDLREGKNTRRFSLNCNYRKDGSVAICEWYNSSLLDASGNVRSILSLVLDVTERVRLDAELKHYNEMLESKIEARTAELREKDRLLLQQNRLAAMGEAVNNIAHQWRQPLNVLGLNIQNLLFLYDLGEVNRELLRSTTEESMKLIEHMSQTIDDFRNFFKPEKEKADFDINQAIQRAVILVTDAFKHDHINVVTHYDGQAVINGYANEFSQALLNVLQNARDALVGGNVMDRRVTITSTGKNGRAVVTIADNAGGIPDGIIDRIFEPYFSTKGIQGTGIGLYMSKSIIENNMGGSITARNNVEGAEFRIEV